MAIPYPIEMVGPDGLLPPAAIASLAARQRIHAWTGFGTLYGTQGVVRAAQREIARLLRPHVRQLAFVSPSTLRHVNRVRRRLGLKFGGFGRKLELLQCGLELVQGRPSETALPLAYWRSGRLPSGGTAKDRTLLATTAGSSGIRRSRAHVAATRAALRRVRGVDHASASAVEPLVTLTNGLGALLRQYRTPAFRSQRPGRGRPRPAMRRRAARSEP